MQRVLSLYLPTWSVDLARNRSRQKDVAEPRDTAQAILIVATSANRQSIAGRCPQAAAAGVRSGMTLAHARALLKGNVNVRIEPFTPERDAASLQRLTQWSMRFSPTVAIDPPDGLLLDITGCKRLFRGERRLAEIILNDTNRLNFSAQLAIAPTIGCAWAMARFSPNINPIVGDGDLDIKTALAFLPVAALRIDEETQDALAMVGIELIEHLFSLPRSALPSRFGPDLLLRMDQALGEAIETIDPIRPAEPVTAERVFDGPVKNLEAIQITISQLIDQLHDQLQQRESGALRLELQLVRIDSDPIHLGAALSRPSRDPKHLWSLLRTRVENVNLGFGVEQITLTATRLGALPHEQTSHWPEAQAPDNTMLQQRGGELLDRLTNRLGVGRVRRFDVVETHIPEQAFVSRPVLEPSASNQRPVQVTESDRPSQLFVQPEPVQVIAATPEGPPSWLKWRGRSQRIVKSQGPERIAAKWWEGPDQGNDARDYFKVQDEHGRWLWIYRQVKGNHWFIHGQWA